MRVVKLYGLGGGRRRDTAAGLVSADGLVLTVFSLLIDSDNSVVTRTALRMGPRGIAIRAATRPVASKVGGGHATLSGSTGDGRRCPVIIHG